MGVSVLGDGMIKCEGKTNKTGKPREGEREGKIHRASH